MMFCTVHVQHGIQRMRTDKNLADKIQMPKVIVKMGRYTNISTKSEGQKDRPANIHRLRLY
jgi:hypothetical protein